VVEAAREPQSEGCCGCDCDCDPMVLETLVMEVFNELNDPSETGKAAGGGGSPGQGWALSHPTIGHAAPVGQRGDLGCHFSQFLRPQFLPSGQLGARGWR